jgi:hypothetical protein
MTNRRLIVVGTSAVLAAGAAVAILVGVDWRVAIIVAAIADGVVTAAVAIDGAIRRD